MPNKPVEYDIKRDFFFFSHDELFSYVYFQDIY